MDKGKIITIFNLESKLPISYYLLRQPIPTKGKGKMIESEFYNSRILVGNIEKTNS